MLRAIVRLANGTQRRDSPSAIDSGRHDTLGPPFEATLRLEAEVDEGLTSHVFQKYQEDAHRIDQGQLEDSLMSRAWDR